MKKFILLILAISLTGCAGMEQKYQSDMDRVRISHIDYLNTLILEYKNKSGQFPLQAKIQNKDIQVVITHREIPGWLAEQNKQLPVDSYSSYQLENDIEKVLGRNIQMPSDPQNVALNRTLMVRGVRRVGTRCQTPATSGIHE